MKVVIIGNGILALSIAFKLLKNSDSDITIVGPSNRFGAATPCAGAMLNSFAELEHGSLDSEASQEYFGMSYLATQQWPDFERELIDYAGDKLPSECASCQVLTGGCFSKGTYIINNAMSDQLEDLNYHAIVKGLDDFNEQYSEVDPKDIPNYFPEPRHRALKALYIHNEGWLNPKIVLKKLDNILYTNPRVTYVDQRVTAISESNGNVTSITTESGLLIKGDEFVLANSFGVSELLSGTSFDEVVQPIFSSVGVSLEIKSPDANHTHVIRTPNRGGGCGIYAVPYFKGPGESKNHVLIGASSVVTIKPRFNGRIVSVAHLLHSAINEINLNFYNAELIHTNVGNRPTSLDQYPLLGRAADSNLLIATGTKRDGFHLAPLISDYIYNLICHPKKEDPYKLFSPTRKLIRNISREKAIDALVVGKINEAYQHGFHASSIFQIQQLESDWRRTITEVHDQVGAQSWGIPNQMLGVYREVLANKDLYANIYNYILRG